MVASKLSDAEIMGLKEMFKAFDKDNSGTITVSELHAGLKNLNLQKKSGFEGADRMSMEEIEELMTCVDLDGDGTISYEVRNAFHTTVVPVMSNPPLCGHLIADVGAAAT